MKGSLYNLILCLGVMWMTFSCTNNQSEQVSLTNGSVPDTTVITDPANHLIIPPEALPDSIQKIIERNKFISKNGVDSLPLNETSWFYNVGANENRFNYLVLIENFGSGSASGGTNISVIKKTDGKYYKIQYLFAFLDEIQKAITFGNYDIALYYPGAAFDHSCPVSVNYKWMGNYYEMAGINYITVKTNVNYSGEMLKKMGIVKDDEILNYFPFIKETDKHKQYDINNIDVDTFLFNTGVAKMFLFKNNSTDGLSADHLWVLKQEGDNYIVIGEQEKEEVTEISLSYKKGEEIPDIIFGLDTLEWTGEVFRIK